MNREQRAQAIATTCNKRFAGDDAPVLVSMGAGGLDISRGDEVETCGFDDQLYIEVATLYPDADHIGIRYDPGIGPDGTSVVIIRVTEELVVTGHAESTEYQAYKNGFDHARATGGYYPDPRD